MLVRIFCIMKKLVTRSLFSAVLLLFLLIAGVTIAGTLMPEHHVASRWVELRQPPPEVWRTITDFAGAAAWRPDIEKVEPGVDGTGRSVWIEVDASGEGIAYATVEEAPPSKLVREIADPELPFGGTWTFELQPTEQGTRLTITERGFVPNPIVRFISAVFIGHTSFMERYLIALGSKYGERVEPRPPS